ncbi:MAG: 4Fe-4S dicluster domain-containing protein [Clostridia bacterium]
MILYNKKENCCGCTACFAICPANAITMTEDEEGFLYPIINENKCVACKKCLTVCVFKRDQIEKGYLEVQDV